MRTVLVLMLLGLAAIFASQNAGMVTVAFLWWHAEASLAVVITVCLASGCAISAIALAPGIVKRHSETRKLRNQLASHHKNNERADT